MTKSKPAHRAKLTSATKISRKVTDQQKAAQAKPRTNSKQAEVIGLLSRPEGSTISAIMKATGWQPHSVRGFFAGIVRNKLGLTLESEKPDGRDRIYRIVAGKPRKPGKPKSNAKNSARLVA
jgi:Protein of unknown function (DUF3489)